MIAWLQSIILNYVLGFILDDLKAAEGKIDWASTKAKVDAWISGEIPKSLASFFDAPALDFANGLLSMAELALSGSLQQTILTDLVSGKFSDALAALKAAIASTQLAANIAPDALEGLAIHAVKQHITVDKSKV